MRRTVLVVFVSLVAALAFALGGASSTETHGKRAAFARGTGLQLLTGSESVLLSTAIDKWKKHRILTVAATITSSSPCIFEFVPYVNGVNLGLIPAHGDLKFSTALGITVSGDWWIDLDEAEDGFPGTFKGQPLQIELRGTNFSAPTGFTGDAVMVARLEKR